MCITDKLFATEMGCEIYKNALSAISDFSMESLIRGGTVLGFSGGADSVMLLLFLLKYRSEVGDFPIVAVHINHKIRGEEANEDENFSRNFCESLHVPFISRAYDVPKIAATRGLGLEEAARDLRYSVFREIFKDKNYTSISVAHNATDNLETIILNMMRGAGTLGLSGISPVRDSIVRPLIYSSKSDISSALSEAGIAYKVDSTNLSTDYSRNYVRQEIIPLFKRLNPDPEAMATRMSHNLRDDNAFIDSYAESFFSENYLNGAFSSEKLAKLPKSVLTRVINKLVRSFFDSEKKASLPERTHIDSISALLIGGNFSYSLPGAIRFVCEGGLCHIEKDIPKKEIEFSYPLHVGVNDFQALDYLILVFSHNELESYSNIYKISIQAKLSSAIIEGNLCVRSKADGDSYRYGGMTRRLKKLFNDRKIPLEKRNNIPVFCDQSGILWVPGFGVRDDGVKDTNLCIAIANKSQNSE